MKDQIINEWINSWFDINYEKFENLFEKDIYYNEASGEEYHGIELVEKWVKDWHTRFKMEQYELKKITHFEDCSFVEFCNESSYEIPKRDNGLPYKKRAINKSNGILMIKWSSNNKITSIKEYTSSLIKYNPFHDY